MAKDLNGFLKSFAGNLGGQMSGGTLGASRFPSPLGLLMGGDDEEDNPGMQMFKGQKTGPGSDGGMVRPVSGGNNDFLKRFAGSLSDQLFQNAMMGFMGRR